MSSPGGEDSGCQVPVGGKWGVGRATDYQLGAQLGARVTANNNNRNSGGCQVLFELGLGFSGVRVLWGLGFSGVRVLRGLGFFGG